MGRAPHRAAALGLALLALLAPPAARAEDPFPHYDALSGNVAFWVRVFAEWNRGQVAVHDLGYPALVYEVVVLPGEREEIYTTAQREFVDGLRADWERFLQGIADKRAAGTPLEPLERQWADYITETAGESAVAEAYKRVRTQRGLRERFREGLGRAARYDAPIRQVFREAGLPEDLAYLPHVESSFQYRAKSSAGAVGLWQFTRSTGRLYMHVDTAVDERLDPLAATRGAAAYLKDAYAALQSWPLALTSYNHGVQGMKKAYDRFGTDFERIYKEYDGKLFGFASRNFYAEFLAARRIAADVKSYFPEGIEPETGAEVEPLRLSVRTSPGSIARTYGVPLAELARLNPSWSQRTVTNNLVLPLGHVVWLPTGSLARAGNAQPPKAEHGRYIVQRGDTLTRIADAHGVSIESLRAANGMSDRQNLIRVGQALAVPDRSAAAADVRHIVRSGESLMRIAADYGVKLGDLLTANTLRVDAVIHPGQVLRIPR